MPKRRVVRHSVTQPTNTSYRFIPLTQGQNAIVDVADFEWLSKFTWHAHWNPHTNSFYARSWSLGRIMMHKLILQYGKGKQADHINHDTLDNRRSNLRICTPMQNAQSRRKRSGTVSRFKGITPHGKKWRANIRVKHRLICLGDFHTEAEAARVYDQAAKQYFGEFAHIN